MERDYPVARERMVRESVFEQGVRDRQVLRAMLEVPRHIFLDRDAGPEVYSAHAFPIGYGQTMSQPYMVGYLAEQLELSGRESVLEIGTGSGYQAAVLARLARQVFTIERIPELAERARILFRDLHVDNVSVQVGDGAKGWLERAPFDRILLTAAAGQVPRVLFGQIRDRGLIVGPVVTHPGSQEVVKIRREGDAYEIARLCPCSFVPLVRGSASTAGSKRENEEASRS